MNQRSKCKQPNLSFFSGTKQPTCNCGQSSSHSNPKKYSGDNTPIRKYFFTKNISSVLLGLGIVFFPKCPLCWVAYMTLFSAAGIETIPYQPWVLPLLMLLLVVNMGVLFLKAKKGGSHGPIWCSAAGVFIIVVSKLWVLNSVLLFMGLFLVSVGSVWNVVPNDWKSIVKSKLAQA